jgi:hypothetical protein
MIRDRQTGQIYHDGEFRALYANISFAPQLSPELLDSLGADVVFEGPQPQTTRYQMVARQGTIQMADGNWYTNYVTVDVSEEVREVMDAQQAISIRAERNRKLTETDWTQVADAPVDKAAWAGYRQALRDVPDQPGFPWDIIWPDAPSY